MLARYVRERGLLRLPEAVRRMTSLAADTFGMAERGRIAPGYHADMVLFDSQTITDTATYDDPKQYPRGIHSVWVNGKLALHEGKHRNAGSGQMLRYRRTAFAVSQ